MPGTWMPGIVPTPAPGMTYAPGRFPASTAVPSGGKILQEAKRTREKFPETWVWETVLSGYVGPLGVLIVHHWFSVGSVSRRKM